ncbi:rhomboid family intramembrane serine protease [Lederbergia wuyishanensis]|uniref:Rhomboid protease GluP n=1 Tax=Lederbergia wuyishanensis TaxID=1347903 RepID=A0ABU0D1E1_9BACI|nr:rhomboid family intramembrane serine protease [Lederbergia wuyishanensis]MCJ8006831.1 rhomboid family intramembrane serine protease [Lederbergia wuyishanensis]MDQ0342215.1 rhomboid protease GluP [Lederbergia wuyishanensis]
MEECGYRLININDAQTGMWFENRNNKDATFIRIIRADLYWANPVIRDQQKAASQAEVLRKRSFRRSLNVLNIYVTHKLPIDAKRFLQEKNVTETVGKSNVSTFILTSEDYNNPLKKISDILNIQIDFLLKEEYEEAEIFILRQGVLKKAAYMDGEEEQKLFEFTKPRLTYFFIVFQIVIFLMIEFNGGTTNLETLIKYGAKFNPLILRGEWWRFITPIFIHIGIFHLAMNTLALYYLGTTVEKMFGQLRFLWIYLFSGVMGTIASFVFTPAISAGASGAIFGCFGALLYLGFTNSQVFFRSIGMNVIIVIIINLIFGFTVQGIDNAGHIGGLIGGFLATGVANFPNKRNKKTQTLFLLSTFIIVSGLLYIGFHNN